MHRLTHDVLNRYVALSPQILEAFPPASCIEVVRFTQLVFGEFGIPVAAVATKLSVLCKALNYQYVTGLSPRERKKGRRVAKNWKDRRASDGTAGYNGHVLSVVDNTFVLDCTLAQASCPEMGFIVEPGATVFPLPRGCEPIDKLNMTAYGRTLSGHEVEITWISRNDRSFESCAAWEPSHMIVAARDLSQQIRNNIELEHTK